MKIVNVILSGGVGSRLWPLSRKARPKQYLPLFAGKSLFEMTSHRNLPICDQLMVVGSRQNYLLSKEVLASAGVCNYLEVIEAVPRNTAAAIAFAALNVNGEDLLLVTPSDHLILDNDTYKQDVTAGINLAKRGHLVTFGIKPIKPETGYGYIEYANQDVISFQEKPDKGTAERFLEAGTFLWNSGIFCFKAGVYLKELQSCSPDVYHASALAWELSQDNFLPLQESTLIPSVSVDYAVMEKSNNIKVVASEFGWSDLGSFEAILEEFTQQKPDHYFCGSNLVLGTKKKVEILGIEDSIVVDTEDALLIVHKSMAQKVRGIYERLEKENPSLT